MMVNPKVLIIDYGMGNLFNIERAIMHVGGSAEISDSPLKIASAERLILPGVGAFGKAMHELKNRGIIEALYAFIQTGRPFMGICLGMQLLLTESHEFGQYNGLNLISGKVVRLKGVADDGQQLKIPHIGWNKIDIPESVEKRKSESNYHSWDGTILQGLNSGSYFYFVHSFVCYLEDAKYVLAESIYGMDRFCSVVRKDNIYGCQFHPEKSGEEGLHIYRNYLFRI